MIPKKGVVQQLRPILKWANKLYFLAINLLFDLLHFFNPKRSVSCTNIDELLLLSATKAAEKIWNRDVTSTELIQAYIHRLEKINPLVNGVVQDNFKRALEEANQIDEYLLKLSKDSQEHKELENKKPLLGVPFTVKDNIQVKGMCMVAGAVERVAVEPSEEDAETVRRLRETGAIVLATSNLPPFATGCEANNPVYGRSRNPYDLRRTTGGSSGGEGALIGSAGSVFGLGNDMSGSVRIPAFYCGIFGLKATEGLISMKGQIFSRDGPNIRKLWALGPMCRYAEDLRTVLRCLVGDEVAKDTLHLDQKVNLEKAKIFYIQDLDVLRAEVITDELSQCIKKAVAHFETKFHLESAEVDLPAVNCAIEMWNALLYSDVPMAKPIPLLWEFCKWMVGRSARTLAGLEFAAVDILTTNMNEIEQFKRLREQLCEDFEKLLGEDGFLVLPALQTTALYHSQSYWKFYNNASLTLFSALGMPAVTCPMGLDDKGLPVGVQIAGARNSEGLLFAVAEEIERAFGGWSPPTGG